MSKLYDQLKNAAFSRKDALEKKERKPLRAKAQEKAPQPLAEQRVIDDEQGAWRNEIAGKLQAFDQQLEGAPSRDGPPALGTIQIPEFDTAEDFRDRRATMATLAEAARKRVEAESNALDRARDREKAERALHAQSEALLQADLAAAKAAREREKVERHALDK
ncbi:MAG: hypothetical protein H7Y14_04125, partial [Burkholderiales bacterium]|nr:hypothetical protein [Burkholderiales bacterium]